MPAKKLTIPKQPVPEFRPDDLIRISVAAKILGVSVPSVRTYIRNGFLHAKRTPGGQRLLDRSQVERFFHDLSIEGEGGRGE